MVLVVPVILILALAVVGILLYRIGCVLKRAPSESLAQYEELVNKEVKAATPEHGREAESDVVEEAL
jgi:hypothetical protein